MPHFGLIDEGALGPVESELMRARLHVRAGRRLLEQGKVRDGLSALFDAVMSSLRWYDITHGRPAGDLVDEREIIAGLQSRGVIDGSFDYDRAYDVIEGLIDGRITEVEHGKLARDFESAMEAIGVIPFDESELPPMPRQDARRA